MTGIRQLTDVSSRNLQHHFPCNWYREVGCVMTVSEPMTAHSMDGDLLTRQQVAYLFRETSAKVATWARRGRLPEVRDDAGKPRYRRADVQALLRARTGRRGPR
jgi:hypothetical protein